MSTSSIIADPDMPSTGPSMFKTELTGLGKREKRAQSTLRWRDSARQQKYQDENVNKQRSPRSETWPKTLRKLEQDEAAPAARPILAQICIEQKPTFHSNEVNDENDISEWAALAKAIDGYEAPESPIKVQEDSQMRGKNGNNLSVLGELQRLISLNEQNDITEQAQNDQSVYEQKICEGSGDEEVVDEVLVEQAENIEDNQSADHQKELIPDEYQNLSSVNQRQFVDIRNVLEFNYEAMSCGSFYPGKMMGNYLRVRNFSQFDQIVELAIDEDTEIYERCQFDQCFNVSDDVSLSSSVSSRSTKSRRNGTISNSEVKYGAWSIENPVTKELQKKIYMRLEPHMVQEFTIVIQGPMNALKTEILVSKLNVSLLTQVNDEFSRINSFDDFLETQFSGNIDNFLQDRKITAQYQRHEVLLNGQVIVPKIVCSKAVKRQFQKNDFLDASEAKDAQQEQVIPLALSMIEPKKKFKIPFKNLSENDLEVEFCFKKISHAFDSRLSPKDALTSEKDDPSPVTFSIENKVVIVPAGSLAISLKLTAKISNDYQFAQNSQQSPLSTLFIESDQEAPAQSSSLLERFNHLLIAKIRGTQVMFPFIVEATIF